jgi:hypothetical protein
MARDQGAVREAMPPLTLAQWAEVPYSPALLLDSRFDVSITDDKEFRKACQCGFDGYFDVLSGSDASGVFTVVEHDYSWSEVVTFLVEDVMAVGEAVSMMSRAWRAGFGLGWLSALALTNRQMARLALEVLTVLIG